MLHFWDPFLIYSIRPSLEGFGKIKYECRAGPSSKGNAGRATKNLKSRTATKTWNQKDRINTVAESSTSRNLRQYRSTVELIKVENVCSTQDWPLRVKFLAHTVVTQDLQIARSSWISSYSNVFDRVRGEQLQYREQSRRIFDAAERQQNNTEIAQQNGQKRRKRKFLEWNFVQRAIPVERHQERSRIDRGPKPAPAVHHSLETLTVITGSAAGHLELERLQKSENDV